jgi:hypothetical protein
VHRLVLPLIAAAVLVAAGVVTLALTLVTTSDDAVAAEVPTETEIAAVAAATGPVEVHRSESCGCCGGHVDHLVDAGFEVEDHVYPDDDAVPALKHELGIPEELWSCHTTVVGGYAVEGHVPADAIVQLVAQAPDVDGITVPGMPVNSPGMGGNPNVTEPFDVLTYTGGQVDGVLASYAG